jgi:hypothetical protein
MKTSFTERVFQLWEFKVSHGSLLIRSPKGPGIEQNIDLICVGVEYLAAPRHLGGLYVEEPTPEEIQGLSQLLGKEVQSSNVRVMVSGDRRFPIVAASFRISENNNDIFDSPFV